jgi:uncharacterized protein (DUF1800 family)
VNHPTRRQLLQTSAAAGAAALALAGCEEVISKVASRLGDELPAAVALPAAEQVDPAYHLLSRAAYGPRPGDVEAVRATGTAAWVEQQLKPESIDDTACALRARRFETAHHAPGTCYEYKKPVLREEMARHTLLRAVYSRRQLFEVMVGFWGDHLNVNIEKGDCIYLKPHDDREVIRRHALGRFRDLIRASATSPAMLVYLDGKENVREKSGAPSNENYARELLELHTVGVEGGYTQRDVHEVARCLTGWRLRTGMRKGTVYLDPKLHDDGEKVVLGQTVPAGQGGEKDLDQVVDIACRHPPTARHVATKLARRFVAEPPPESLVVRLAEVFVRTDGDIKSVLRELLNSSQFAASAGAKFKTPFRFVVSALRAVGADTHAHGDLIDYLGAMGQGVFQHPTPDGYPDEAAAWTGTLLWRWNFAFALAAGQVPSVKVPLAKLRAAIEAGAAGATAPTHEQRAFRYLIGRSPSASEGAALAEGSAALRAAGNSGDAGLFGLLLASPAFQRH